MRSTGPLSLFSSPDGWVDSSGGGLDPVECMVDGDFSIQREVIEVDGNVSIQREDIVVDGII